MYIILPHNDQNLKILGKCDYYHKRLYYNLLCFCAMIEL